jgi:hypothetical protein
VARLVGAGAELALAAAALLGGARSAMEADTALAVPERRRRGLSVRRGLRLPQDVRCFAIAATRTPTPGERRYATDGIVPLDSALGRHARPELTLAFDDTWIGFGMGHVEVLERPEMHAVLRQWLSPSVGGPSRSRARAAEPPPRRHHPAAT